MRESSIDQTGWEIQLNKPAKTAISLVPSVTEFLIDLGVKVIGRTKFCIYPEHNVGDIPVIGGTKDFKVEQILSLSPDIVIANKEENTFEGIEKLRQQVPVWTSDIRDLGEAYYMMKTVGELFGLEEKASGLANELSEKLKKIQSGNSGTVLYFIWKEPWLVAGRSTFVNHMLQHMGYVNLETRTRYPELTADQRKSLKPDKILLSSEPFPFRKKHVEEVRNLFPDAKIELVNGELFSWYGTRLLRLVS